MMTKTSSDSSNPTTEKALRFPIIPVKILHAVLQPKFQRNLQALVCQTDLVSFRAGPMDANRPNWAHRAGGMSAGPVPGLAQ